MVGGVGRIEDPAQVREPFPLALVDDRAAPPHELHKREQGMRVRREQVGFRFACHSVHGVSYPPRRGGYRRCGELGYRRPSGAGR